MNATEEKRTRLSRFCTNSVSIRPRVYGAGRCSISAS